MFTQWLTRTSLRVRRISRLHNISSLRHASPNRAFSPMCNFFSKKRYIYYYLLMHRSNVGETLSPPSHTPCPRNNVMVLLLLLHCTLRYTTHKPPRRPPPKHPHHLKFSSRPSIVVATRAHTPHAQHLPQVVPEHRHTHAFAFTPFGAIRLLPLPPGDTVFSVRAACPMCTPF